MGDIAGSGFSRLDVSFPGFRGVRSQAGNWKIYVLVDPRDRSVRYVGQTRNVEKRRKTHLRTPRRSDGLSLWAWKTELASCGHKPQFLVVDATNGNVADLENRWILYYRGIGKLYNVSFSDAPRAAYVPSRAQVGEAVSRAERHVEALARYRRLARERRNADVNAFLEAK